LKKREANYKPLNPLSFLQQTVKLHPNITAYVHGSNVKSWKEAYSRISSFSSYLSNVGISRNDVVSIICPNSPAIFEAHFAIPGVDAVLLTMNTRLDPTSIVYQLIDSESKVILFDTEYNARILEVKKQLIEKNVKLPLFIAINDSEYQNNDKNKYIDITTIDYESAIESGDASFQLIHANDEWDTIALNYTSGTTGNPKGVLTHYRGAYLNALTNQLNLNMKRFSKYLWGKVFNK
jgi:fatty-acyl-CoA synthase